MEMKIKLSGIQEVKEFVTAAGKCDFDVDIFYNRVVIDAKSILGVLSMDLSRVLSVRAYGVNKGFQKILEKYAVQDVAA